MDDILLNFNHIVASLLGFIGVCIILLGSLKGVFLHFTKKKNIIKIRIMIGQYLTFGLELLVGKDIIESIIRPTWEDLGKLMTVILIRTILTIFIERELKAINSRMTNKDYKK